MSQQLDETSHKASRAASTVADAFQDGVETVRCAAKHGEHVATELFYNTKMRVRQHPVESVLATFAVGLVARALIVPRVTRNSA